MLSAWLYKQPGCLSGTFSPKHLLSYSFVASSVCLHPSSEVLELVIEVTWKHNCALMVCVWREKLSVSQPALSDWINAPFVNKSLHPVSLLLAHSSACYTETQWHFTTTEPPMSQKHSELSDLLCCLLNRPHVDTDALQHFWPFGDTVI